MLKSLFVFFIFNSKKSSKSQGFSLLELAIVLLVIGILTSLSLPFINHLKTREAFLKTQKNQDYIIQAIAAYVIKYQHFPCPSDPTAAEQDFGVSRKLCRGKRAEGIVPYRTLGINQSYAKDGFHNYFTYVVEEDLTFEMTSLNAAKGGHLHIKDAQNNFVLLENISNNFVAFLLISHGKTGTGAFQIGTSLRKKNHKNLSSHKLENNDGKLVYVISSNSDHIVKWESRDVFLKIHTPFLLP